jgi:phage-related protein
MKGIGADILYHGDCFRIDAITVGGVCLARDFIEGLERPDQKKVVALLQRAADFGPPINEEKFKKLNSEGIYEFKSYQVRIFCAFEKGRIIILTHGFAKKSGKTPRHEIERATRLLAEYRALRERQ